MRSDRKPSDYLAAKEHLKMPGTNHSPPPLQIDPIDTAQLTLMRDWWRCGDGM